MAQFIEDPNQHDLSDDLLDTADWNYLDPPPGTADHLTVTSGSTPIGDRFFRRPDSGNSFSAAHWTAPGNPTDVEWLLLVRTTRGFEPWLRADETAATSWTSASGDGIGAVAQIRPHSSTFRFREYDLGVNLNGMDAETNPNYTDWYYVRIRLNGSSGEVTHWLHDQSEPATPNMSGTLTEFLSGGAVILSLDRFGDYDFAWISLGTDSDPAPMPEEAEPPWTLTVNVAGDGSVAKDPDLAEYDDLATVDLTATPDAGWTFDNPLWTGPDSPTDANENPTTILMDSDKSLTANFVEVDVGEANRRVWWDGGWRPAAA